MKKVERKSDKRLPLPASWLPDWKDKNQYLFSPKTSPEQWAWEFIRRSRKYQNLWMALEIRYRKNPKILKKAKNLRATRQIDGSMKFSSPKADLSDLCRFANMFHFFFGFLSFPAPPSENFPSLEFDYLQIVVKPSNMHPHKNFKPEILITEKQAGFIFNLGYPLGDQIRYAKKWMKEYKNEHEIKEFRLRPSEYPFYLRILDAKALRIKDDDIAEIIYPGTPNEYEDDYRGRKKVQESYAEARFLRDRDFRLGSVPNNFT